jgi:zinc protease
MGGRMMRALAGGLGIGVASFTVETKRAKLPAVLEILRQILREPTLPGSEFEVIKNEEIAGIEQGLSDPMRQGFNQIQRLLARHYPKDDVRYVPTLSERLERTRNVSLDQVRALYQGYLGADHGELAIVGDFELSEILPILGKTFEGWKAERPYARIERTMPRELKPEQVTIPTPDKANAVYVAGLQVPLTDSDPDYPALLAGNYVLGGGSLSSRIADRLRQKGGLSYGAGSIFAADPLDPLGILMIFAIYNPSNVDKVATGVDEEVKRLLRDGVQPDELERAKKGYLQQQQVMRTNDMTLAVLLTEDLYVGRTLQFQADLEAKIQALTPEAVDAALRKHIHPEQLSVVKAGDFAKKK